MSTENKFLVVNQASRSLVLINDSQINKVLNELASKAESEIEFLISENQKDLDRMDQDDPKYDRLMLTPDRIRSIAGDLRNVSGLTSPLGKVLKEKTLDNGMLLRKTTVPLGVIGIIYEARPNVTFDVFSLCLKSGNACILKGGSDAEFSNRAIAGLIHQVLKNNDIDQDVLWLMEPDRSSTDKLLNAVGLVDIIIPRGSQALIDFVRLNARVPVIETGAGIVHTYFDKDADLEKGAAIVFNAKTRRVSVCNALDCLIMHQDRIGDLPEICARLGERKVEIFADGPAYEVLRGHYPDQLLSEANEAHFGTEFLSLKMSVRTVKNLNEAMDHIARFSSRHSEAIISENKDTIELFLQNVDAATVYSNVSTAFTDGAQFGLGAEIGISTQKLHARGPMALEELTSYKWIVRGNGQVRIP